MTIKFHVKGNEEEAKLTFGMVKYHQFFIDQEGDLCQKVNGVKFNRISMRCGTPYAQQHVAVSRYNDLCYGFDNLPIQKILPEVTKITWE